MDLHEKLSSLAHIEGTNRPFEVYAFEASPYIAPFVEEAVTNKNLGLPPPVVPFPTSGSSKDLKRFNKENGLPCPTQVDELRKCYLKTYETVLDQLTPSDSLNSSTLINNRLSLAKLAHFGPESKYVFIPAAASDKDSWLTLEQCKLGLLIGGVTTKGPREEFSRLGDTCFPPSTVHTVDVPGWIKRSFSETDFVVLKMDIEGAEHDIIKTLIRTQTHALIDILAWECHPKGGDCAYTRKLLQDLTQIKVFEEGKDYDGWLT